MAEPADDRPVQFHLVDLARDIPRPRRIAVGVGVGGEDILVRARRNANGPANSKVVVDLLRLEVVVEDLVPKVRAVGDPDVALPIDLQPVRQVELTGFLTGVLTARLREEPAVLVELHHAVVAVSIGDENVALRVETHIRRAAENVLLCGTVRAGGRRDGAVHCRWPAAEHHKELALRAELRDGVGAFVDGPDIVLRIDANRVRELETVIALADFLDEIAVLIELEQPCVGAAVIDEDMALGIGRDRDGFAEILAGRNLQEVRHRRVTDFGHILRGRLLLRERRSGGQHQNHGEYGRETMLHRSLPANSDDTVWFGLGPKTTVSISNRQRPAFPPPARFRAASDPRSARPVLRRATGGPPL